MIKTKIENPKEDIQKEISNQNQKLERIKKAYVNGTFKLEEYDEERKIVRIFPLEDYRKMDKIDKLKLGVIYVNDGDKSILENEEDVFEYLPPVVNSTEYELDEESRKKREQIEKEWNELKNNK